MNDTTWRYFTVTATVVAIVLSILAANATVLSVSDAETGDGLVGKEGIGTSDRNITVNDTAVVGFWANATPRSDKTFDIRKLRVHWITPDGNYTLELADGQSPSQVTGKQFAVRVIRDEDDSAPIMNHPTDTVRVFVRPLTFLSANESRLDPIVVKIDAPGIYREKIVIRNVTTSPEFGLPITTVTETDRWSGLSNSAGSESTPENTSSPTPLGEN